MVLISYLSSFGKLKIKYNTLWWLLVPSFITKVLCKSKPSMNVLSINHFVKLSKYFCVKTRCQSESKESIFYFYFLNFKYFDNLFFLFRSIQFFD